MTELQPPLDDLSQNKAATVVPSPHFDLAHRRQQILNMLSSGHLNTYPDAKENISID